MQLKIRPQDIDNRFCFGFYNLLSSHYFLVFLGYAARLSPTLMLEQSYKYASTRYRFYTQLFSLQAT